MLSARYGGTSVPGQTKTRRQNMLVCSQHVSVQEASATAQNRRDMIALSGYSEKVSSSILDRLNSSDKIVALTHAVNL